MSDITPSMAECIQRIRRILSSARARALQSVNAEMLAAYWEIGREIVEEEQRGQKRAGYGKALIRQLSEELTQEFGKGYSLSNLKYFRQFYLTYQDRSPPLQPVAAPRSIGHGARGQLDLIPSSSGEAALSAPRAPLSAELSWTHYRTLMRVKSAQARDFYEAEAIRTGWTVPELERQMGSLLYERLAMSRDKEGLLALAREGHAVHTPTDLIKDPYVLEFTGLPEPGQWQESDLEQALVDRLQQFLLELGHNLFFVARQKRLTIDGDHFYIDLVFYHRILRCFLLIDLKTGRLTQQDVGQMLLYVGYYQTEEMEEGENPPVGLILCTDKNEAAVRYTLTNSASQVFTSRYQLHLPSEEELRAELIREREILETRRNLEE